MPIPEKKRPIISSVLALAVVVLTLAGFGLGYAPADSHAAPVMFPFILPWDDSSDSLTNINSWNETPAGKHGFIQSLDGHFYSGGNRIKFLGVNMVMGANFPTSSDARKVAARMAKFGINCVRLTHLDWDNTPNGILEEDLLTFDSDQLKRLDYFVSQMKKRGIYADLNLHVSRNYPGFPTWADMPVFYKGIDHFFPAMIEMQKEYASTLLNHRNRYTNKRYKDDPVVALIEINNEDSLIYEWCKGHLDGMPAIFQNELGRQYSEWLSAKRDTTAPPDTVNSDAAISTSGRKMVKLYDFKSLPRQEQDDWLSFLYDVEEKYFTQMKDYLQQEIGVGSLIIGTQVGYSLAPIQQKMDVIAVHSYWQHPHFPSGSWDTVNWFVPNYSMAGDHDGGTVRTLASYKVVGMPFIATEYAHPAPNTYGSEGLLIASAYAALHDWDGILIYEYSGRRDDWDPQYFTNYFSIDSHPTKMATFQAAAAMFLRGDVRAAPEIAIAQSSKEEALQITRTEGPEKVNTDYLGVDAIQSMYHRIGMSFDQTAPAGQEFKSPGIIDKLKRKLNRFIDPRYQLISTTKEVIWHGGSTDGMVTVNTPKSKLFVGRIQGRQMEFDGIVVRPSSELQDWATVSLTVMEGDGFQGPARVLLTATGYAENTDMGWKDAGKTTVGQDWGGPPSLVEGIKATIIMPCGPDSIRVWSLDEKGDRDREIGVGESEGQAAFEIGPRYETLWYEIEIN